MWDKMRAISGQDAQTHCCYAVNHFEVGSGTSPIDARNHSRNKSPLLVYTALSFISAPRS